MTQKNWGDWLHQFLVYWAQRLQVTQPQSVWSWLIHLFLRPARRHVPFTVDPDKVPHPGEWWRAQFQIPHHAPPWMWWWRLWVRPRPAPLSARDIGWALLWPVRMAWHILDWTLLWSWQTLRWLSRCLFWPVVWLMKVLGRVGQVLAQKVDQASATRTAQGIILPILMFPGMRWIMGAAMLGIAWVVTTTPFNWVGQLSFMFLCWACAMVLRELHGHFAALAMATLSMVSLGRYVWWRVNNTLDFNSFIESVLGYGLLLAESYTWLIVVLGFIQTAWPLKRPSATLPASPQEWPVVDVYIPTYNEPMSVVYPTALAALGMDWPRDKLRVHILDDGRREAFREMAETLGVGYIIRPDNKHAKAGNLNHALTCTSGELIAIFDCDHIPTRGFLKEAVGWFLRDPRCAMVQTPHHFFSPDPFERNLGTFRSVPNEGALFYGLVQDGNDMWNATFFCGSCAVIRREPLLEVGGIAVETVTEDAHTALKLHSRGYNTAYINKTLAAGLATESLSAHIGQRIRWARGMAQIFRLDNPFFMKGLSIWQRICYSNAMLHFFFGWPRLVFLTAPMSFLFFNLHVINTSPWMLLLFGGPYILLAALANARVQGKYRHSFWAEVYETVLAWYVMRPTTVALFKPKAGTFNVTAKGGLVEESYFDWGISKPYIILVALNFIGMGLGVIRLFSWNTHETGTVLMNMTWTLYSLIMLGASLGVAAETKQVRRTHRVAADLPAALYLSNGQVLVARCVDFSMQGVALNLPEPAQIKTGEMVYVSMWRSGAECALPAQVALNKGKFVGLQFEALSLEQEIDLVQCTFARPDAWAQWADPQIPDRPLQGLQEITKMAWVGYQRLGRNLRDSVLAVWGKLRHAGESAVT